jgi:hypothetical protein
MSVQRSRARRALEFVPLAALLVLLAGGAWLLFRPHHPAAAGLAPPSRAATHQPCDAVALEGSPPASGAVESRGWRIRIAGTRILQQVPASDGGSFDAAPGKEFLVIDLAFRRVAGAGEAGVDSSAVRLLCADGTAHTADGVRIEGGYCFECFTDVRVKESHQDLSVVFRLFTGQERQTFILRYADAPPLLVPAPA